MESVAQEEYTENRNLLKQSNEELQEGDVKLNQELPEAKQSSNYQTQTVNETQVLSKRKQKHLEKQEQWLKKKEPRK